MPRRTRNWERNIFHLSLELEEEPHLTEGINELSSYVVNSIFLTTQTDKFKIPN